jgi:hypothetical protein
MGWWNQETAVPCHPRLSLLNLRCPVSQTYTMQTKVYSQYQNMYGLQKRVWSPCQGQGKNRGTCGEWRMFRIHECCFLHWTCIAVAILSRRLLAWALKYVVPVLLPVLSTNNTATTIKQRREQTTSLPTDINHNTQSWPVIASLKDKFSTEIHTSIRVFFFTITVMNCDLFTLFFRMAGHCFDGLRAWQWGSHCYRTWKTSVGRNCSALTINYSILLTLCSANLIFNIRDKICTAQYPNLLICQALIKTMLYVKSVSTSIHHSRHSSELFWWKSAIVACSRL